MMNFGAIIKEYPQLSERANSNYITVWGYILTSFNKNNLQQIEGRAEMWTQVPLLLLRIINIFSVFSFNSENSKY